jgi:hypothetical protein
MARGVFALGETRTRLGSNRRRLAREKDNGIDKPPSGSGTNPELVPERRGRGVVVSESCTASACSSTTRSPTEKGT